MRYFNHHKLTSGFTMVELLITVALIGIIATIGIPVYRGYINTADAALAQSHLRGIYLQQGEYLRENGAYYSTGAACDQYADEINTDLFNGKQVLKAADGFDYCITQDTEQDFEARAEETNGERVFTLNQNNVANF